ncbi:MAG: DedA family protein [Bdellovibrionales bacterium]|nr:DedA family protein [Bdellovibrionales bacterium]
MDQSSFGYKVFSMFVGLSGFHAYAFIFGVLLACGLGVPIPEDVTLIAAGYLAGKQQITFLGALVVGFIGVMAGDTFLFTIGRRFGKKVFTWPGARAIFTPERVERAEAKIQKNARLICFVARFMPGLRSPIFLTAGTMGVPYRTFFIQDGGAALISVPVWIWAGWKFYEEIEKAFGFLASAKIYIVGAIGLIVLYYFVKSRFRREPNQSDQT